MNELRLTPVELYFLGTLLDAEYIDYQYVSALPDIQNNYRVIEEDTIEKLEEKGLVEQDFDGTVSVEESVLNLLKPIFFGEIECRVNTTWSEGNLHIFDKAMTFVSKEHNHYLIEALDDEQLHDLIEDQELDLHAMDIQKGFLDKSFTEEEMGLSENINSAIAIMKGDW